MTSAGSADDWHRLVFDSTTAAMIMIDREGVVRRANPETQRMFGYDNEELIGCSVEILLPQSLRPTHASLRRGFLADPVSRPMGLGRCARGARRDGTEFPVEVWLSVLENQAEDVVLATVFDLAARRNEQAALAHRNAELESANQRLARFAFLASQDLQDPLRKIAAFGDLLNEAIACSDFSQITHANDVMRRSARRAHALVHDLLAFSRIVNDPLEQDILDLRRAIDVALAGLSQQIEDAQAQIDIRLPPVQIEADRTQLERLVENIVSNAIKYRKPNQPPTVDISAFCDESAVCLTIADRGIGFEEQYAHKIFEPLKRLHSRVDYPGSGIGLAICKAIADRHGWRISVEAKPGVGATFFIVMPICEAAGRCRRHFDGNSPTQ
jgi:PAS domain S-box-containing protein